MDILVIILAVVVGALAVALFLQMKAAKKQTEDQQQLLKDYEKRVNEQQRLLEDYDSLSKNFDSIGKGYEQALLLFDKMADIQPALKDGGVDLEMDCSELTYMASSGLRIIQKTMRTVMQQRGQFKMTNVSPEIYKVLAMTGFTKFMKVEQKKD